ncbi:MAG: hypothetical protein QFX34_03725 [Candidatus Verstraetearchaeota archaeon]|nr:hypothetical protein [Candidatus Verstraetearchaeota archaeon]
MSEDASLAKKIRKAAQLIMYQHHRLPGVKGYELRKYIGRDFMKIVSLLQRKLDDLGLEVKIVYADGLEHPNPTEEELEQARFYVISKAPLQMGDASLSGWRIDTLAVFAATVAYLTSKQGRAPRRDVEELLQEKFPDWKIDQDLNRFIRRGYLDEDQNCVLFIGWRTRVEIDRKRLLDMIAGSSTDKGEPESGSKI